MSNTSRRYLAGFTPQTVTQILTLNLCPSVGVSNVCEAEGITVCCSSGTKNARAKCIALFPYRLSDHPLFMQKQRGPFYHVNGVNAYLGRQRWGGWVPDQQNELEALPSLIPRPSARGNETELFLNCSVRMSMLEFQMLMKRKLITCS